MPKELTHMAVSELALRQLTEEGDPAGALLGENRAAYMLGTLICDSAYYHLPFVSGRKITYLSASIHTRHGALSAPFCKRLLKAALAERGDASFAFACGVLSHHLADRTFHPFIIHLTGDYENPDGSEKKAAQARHRFLEGLADCRVGVRLLQQRVEDFDPAGQFPSGEREIIPLLSLFIDAVSPDEANTRKLRRLLYRALRFELWLCRRYALPSFRGAVLRLNRLLGGRIGNFAALLYPPDGGKGVPFPEGLIGYRNPFSGDERRDSFESLALRASKTLAHALSGLYAERGDIEGAERIAADLFGEEAKSPPVFMETDAADLALMHFLEEVRR